MKKLALYWSLTYEEFEVLETKASRGLLYEIEICCLFRKWERCKERL